MSIHINCPSCHTISSLTLSKLPAQIPVSTRPAFREHPSPTADLSDIPMDGVIRRAFAIAIREQEKTQNRMARHGHGHHISGHVVNPTYAGSPIQPIPHGQSEQVFWQNLGIPTRNKGDAHYAIHRAVLYAYDKGYDDAKKSRVKYHHFKQVLDEADRKEFAELRDRLGRERKDLTRTYIDGLTASQIRESIVEAVGARQRHHGGHRDRHARRHGDRSRARSHRRNRSPRRNYRNRERRFDDTDSSESYGDDDYDYP